MDAGRGSARPALIAVNPRASRLRDAHRRQEVLAAARRMVGERTGLEPEVFEADDAPAMIARAASAVDEGAPLLVALGGDGTVRDLAAVLLGKAVPLAIVPVGTANLFAATLGLSMRPGRAIASMRGGLIRRVDVGRVRWGIGAGDASGSRLCVVAAGIGFDARVMAATGDGAKGCLGRYAYFVAAARELARLRSADIRLETDGEVLELRVQEVLVANAGLLIPGVLRPALPIAPSDGRLDVFVVAGSGLPGAALGALEVVLRRGQGRSPSGRSWRLRARSVRVASTDEVPVEVDGDVVGRGWLEAGCEPGALRVLVPHR